MSLELSVEMEIDTYYVVHYSLADELTMSILDEDLSTLASILAATSSELDSDLTLVNGGYYDMNPSVGLFILLMTTGNFLKTGDWLVVPGPALRLGVLG